jgi:phosphoserine phosphatase
LWLTLVKQHVKDSIVTLTSRWTSFDLIFFDCDSTLSSIEGVDELARLKGKEWRVSLLTQKAMNGDLDLRDVYGKRLKAINPTRGQLAEIEQMYWDCLVPDAIEVIAALHLLGKQVFIISGGLAAPVRGFGNKLGVPAERIRAVELEFNELSGEWWKYYDQSAQTDAKFLDFEASPLTISAGKPQIVTELANGAWGRKLFIGDGMSDLHTKSVVDLFVGFGGVVRREKVESGSDAFVAANSLAPILLMAAGEAGLSKLANTPFAEVVQRGLAMCYDTTSVLFHNVAVGEAFTNTFNPHYDALKPQP